MTVLEEEDYEEVSLNMYGKGVDQCAVKSRFELQGLSDAGMASIGGPQKLYILCCHSPSKTLDDFLIGLQTSFSDLDA